MAAAQPLLPCFVKFRGSILRRIYLYKEKREKQQVGDLISEGRALYGGLTVRQKGELETKEWRCVWKEKVIVFWLGEINYREIESEE